MAFTRNCMFIIFQLKYLKKTEVAIFYIKKHQNASSAFNTGYLPTFIYTFCKILFYDLSTQWFTILNLI